MKSVRRAGIRCAVAASVLLAAHAQAALAAATTRPEALQLVPIGRVASLPVTDGVRLLWNRSPGVVGLLRPGRPGRGSMALDAGCELVDATSAGLTLVGCGFASAGTAPGYLIKVPDRERIPLPARAVPSGRERALAEAIGRHWIRLLIGFPCGDDPGHCGGSTRYVNWRTGEAFAVDDDTDSDLDLDRSRLSRSSPSAGFVATDATGRLEIEGVSASGGERVVLRRGGHQRLMDLCPASCSSPALQGRLAAWIETLPRAPWRTVLHVRDTRDGRSWRGPATEGSFDTQVWIVGSAILATLWPATERGPYPLYRVRLQHTREHV